ncbi:MAG: hypothetical protein AB7U38_01855 [Hyphomicrobiales bacterium]
MARYSQDTAPKASDVPFTPTGDITETDVQAALVQAVSLLLAKTAGLTAIVVLTETEYDALDPPAATRLYLVTADA